MKTKRVASFFFSYSQGKEGGRDALSSYTLYRFRLRSVEDTCLNTTAELIIALYGERSSPPCATGSASITFWVESACPHSSNSNKERGETRQKGGQRPTLACRELTGSGADEQRHFTVKRCRQRTTCTAERAPEAR